MEKFLGNRNVKLSYHRLKINFSLAHWFTTGKSELQTALALPSPWQTHFHCNMCCAICVIRGNSQTSCGSLFWCYLSLHIIYWELCRGKYWAATVDQKERRDQGRTVYIGTYNDNKKRSHDNCVSLGSKHKRSCH